MTGVSNSTRLTEERGLGPDSFVPHSTQWRLTRKSSSLHPEMFRSRWVLSKGPLTVRSPEFVQLLTLPSPSHDQQSIWARYHILDLVTEEASVTGLEGTFGNRGFHRLVLAFVVNSHMNRLRLSVNIPMFWYPVVVTKTFRYFRVSHMSLIW